MDISAIRRANLLRLAATYPTKTAFAQAAGIDISLLYKILHGQKNMGNALAKRAESTLNLTSGSISTLDYVQNVHKNGTITPDQQDPQRALMELLAVSALSREDARLLLHLALRLKLDDSCTAP